MRKEKVNERMGLLKEAIYAQEKLQSEISERYETDEQFLLLHDTEKEIEEFLKNFLELNPEIKKEYELASQEKTYLINRPIIEWFTNDNYGFSDEWAQCEDCSCIFRLPSADISYYKDGIIYEGEFDDVVCCKKCLDTFNKEDYINSKKNSSNEWIIMYSVDDMKELGWKKINNKEYEYGSYGVLNDPKIILEKAQKEYPDKDFVFVRINESPFHQESVLMMKEKEED